ncbi:MAG: chromate transporter [Sphaerochaetaceae bacterium]|nr:chromate transporter [Sphaerochaetaceae bacterium]
MNTLLILFWEFFKAGLFAVGGGMATIPFLFDIGERTGWYTAAELADMIAVSESTPGPIGVNMATFVGMRVGGIAGAVTSTIGLIAPSVIIILIVITLLDKVYKLPLVQTVFSFLRACTVGLIANAFLQVAVLTFFDGNMNILVTPLILFAVVFVLINVFKKVHPIVWIALGAVAGILIY